MFAPTRTWRRWHRRVNVNQRRYALASAVAASAVPALVLARGHLISEIPEVPLVLETDVIETLNKTKAARALLDSIKAGPDVDRCQTVQKHAGVARLRNRPKKIKVGPLIVTGNKTSKAYLAFRNLLGVQTINVFKLDLLQLAPGGHLGRFVIWTKSAIEHLNTIFGSFKTPSVVKKGYLLPRSLLQNPDIRRVIKSDAVQALVQYRKRRPNHRKKPNYVSNRRALDRINPYARVVRKVARQRNQTREQLKAKLAAAGPKKTIQKKAESKPKKDGSAFTPIKSKHLLDKYRKLVYGQ